MPKVHLTDKKIKSLKTSKPHDDFWDTGFRARNISYGIRVFANGVKKHTARYRRHDGKQRRVMLGEYGERMGLADAHEKARGLAAELDGGADPAGERDAYKVALTFAELSALYLKLHAAHKKKPRSYQEDRRLIEVFLNPAWQHRKACDVQRKEVIALLDHIHIERKAPIQANRVRALIHKMFNFALVREIVSANPCAGLPKVAPEKRRERVLKEEEIVNLWQALAQIQEPIASLFKLILLTAQRPGEVKSLRWRDIQEGSIWVIPAEVTKNGRIHRVPLSLQARRILEALRTEAAERKVRSRKADTSAFDEYAFHHHRGTHIKWLHRATARLNEAMEGEKFVPHDLRRTAATFMRSLGVSRDTISKILNHTSADHSVTGVYDRYDEWPEMKEALQRWGKKVDQMVKKHKTKKRASSLPAEPSKT